MIADSRQMELDLGAALPQYAVGDHITLIDAPPDSMYEIVRLSPTHATCRCLVSRPGQSSNNRSVTLWKIRPACSISTVPPDASAKSETDCPRVVPPGCPHPRMSIGLDRAHCPDCNREFPSWTKEYRAVLEQPYKKTAPDKTPQASAQVLSGATPTITAPDKTPQAPAHWTETYCPARRKEHRYYRYVWMEKRRLRHRHIPGGNVRSEVARLNLLEVELAIAQGRSPCEIEQMIKSWRADPRRKKAPAS